jgi:hypothetical protein
MKINFVFIRDISTMLLGMLVSIMLFYSVCGIWGLITDIGILILTLIVFIKLYDRLNDYISNTLNMLKKSKLIRNVIKVISFALLILFPVPTFSAMLMIYVSAGLVIYCVEND